MLPPGLRTSLVVLSIAGLLGAAGASAADLPLPSTLVPRVEFWKRVYSEVGTDGGLIHDTENLGVVYEVVRAPSSRSLSSRAKKAKAKYRGILRKLALGRGNLSDEERRVLALFPKGVSKKTLAAAADRVRFQLGQANKFRDGIRRMGRWEGFIRRAMRERGVPEDLVALPHVESSYNPKAYSHAGASGLWQFMPGTARMFMRLDHVMDERRDPFIASVGAARLLRANYDKTGTWPLAITAYNHGAAGMSRAASGSSARATSAASWTATTAVPSASPRSNFYSEFMAARCRQPEPREVLRDRFARTRQRTPKSSSSTTTTR